MNSSLALSLSQVHKKFGSVHAVSGIDLDVQPGEIVALLGPNGAGKTSTIDMVLGLSDPTSGRAQVFGLDPRQAVAKGLVSAVMQTGGLLTDITVRETLELIGTLFAHRRDIDDVMQRAGISEIGDRKVGKCSGGQQQRLRFAMALLPDPQLIILDEPTTGMDVTARRAFWNAMRLDSLAGVTVIFATHYLEEADDFADRIVLLREGSIVADGSAASIRNLASGRVISADIALVPATTLTGLLSQTRTLPGVSSVELRGEQVTVVTEDSDTAARLLLSCHEVRDMEITSRNLEDAFIMLTSGESTSSSSAPIAVRK